MAKLPSNTSSITAGGCLPLDVGQLASIRRSTSPPGLAPLSACAGRKGGWEARSAGGATPTASSRRLSFLHPLAARTDGMARAATAAHVQSWGVYASRANAVSVPRLRVQRGQGGGSLSEAPSRTTKPCHGVGLCCCCYLACARARRRAAPPLARDDMTWWRLRPKNYPCTCVRAQAR